MLAGKRLLLVIAGGIAAYKSLELIRRLRERGAARARDLDHGRGRIRYAPFRCRTQRRQGLSGPLLADGRERDGAYPACRGRPTSSSWRPASADLLAKMAHGLADDLASHALLATDKPIAGGAGHECHDVAPSRDPGQSGDTEGAGRAPDRPRGGRSRLRRVRHRAAWPSRCRSWRRSKATSAPSRRSAVGAPSSPAGPPSSHRSRPLHRQSLLGQAGPCHRSGTRPARRDDGAGLRARRPSPTPPGVEVHRIESAEQMLAACRAALPADIAVCAAAVADWRPAKTAERKIKKAASDPAPIALLRNPDILAALSASGNERPRLVVGFAAETEDLIANARKKLAAKGCDLIVANDVSAASGTFGGRRTRFISWPRTASRTGRN